MCERFAEHRFAALASIVVGAFAATLPGCSESDCGEGTVERDGECVASAKVSCGEGTILQGDRCLVLCAEPGMVQSPADGACVYLRPDFGEATENNDPTTGGVASRFVLPPVGSTIWLGGVVHPPGMARFDGTNPATNLVPDVDVFEFEAVAGQVLAIEAINAGTSSAAFVVARASLYSDLDLPVSESLLLNDPDGPWVGRDYPRWGISYWGDRPLRTIRILETGTYYLAVSDRDNFMRGLRGTGCRECGYLISVTAVAPEEIPVTEGDLVEFDIAGSGAAIRPGGLSPDGIYQLTFSTPPTRPNVRWFYALGDEDRVIYGVPDYLVPGGEGYRYIPLGTEHYNAVRFSGSAKRLHLETPKVIAEEETRFTARLTRVPVSELGTMEGTEPVRAAENVLSGPDSIQVFHLTAGSPGRTTLLRIRADQRDDGSGNPFDVGIAVKDADYAATHMKYAQANPFNPDENFFWQNVIQPGVHGAINDIVVLLTDRTSLFLEVSADLPADPRWPFAGPVTYDLVAGVTAEIEVEPIHEMAGDENWDVTPWLNAALPLGILDGQLPLVLKGKLDRIFFDADFFSFTVTRPTTMTILAMPDVPYETPKTQPGAQLYGPTQNFGILTHARAEGDSHTGPGFTRIPGGFVTVDLAPADYFLVASALMDQGFGTPPNPPGYVGGYTLVLTEGAYR